MKRKGKERGRAGGKGTVHSMTVSISLFLNDIKIFRLYQYLVNFECRGLFFDEKKYISR